MRLAVVAALLVSAVPGYAQRQVDVKGSIGVASFVDELPDHHLLTGGSVRFYLTRRFSIEPEVLYLYRDSRHYDMIVMPNVVYDFGGSRVVPYVTGGVGLLRTTDSGFARPFTHNEAAVTGGGGVKLYLTDRWFVAPEARIGFEAHIRLSAGIGYTWRR
jgi:hypothetical protein